MEVNSWDFLKGLFSDKTKPRPIWNNTEHKRLSKVQQASPVVNNKAEIKVHTPVMKG